MSETKFVSGADVQAKLDELQRGRVSADTRMQCKVCWYIYDPEQGCPEWCVEPGTPFYDLPEEFTCPDCGHPKNSFLPADDDMNFD